MALPSPQLGGISLIYHLGVNIYFGIKSLVKKAFKAASHKYNLGTAEII